MMWFWLFTEENSGDSSPASLTHPIPKPKVDSDTAAKVDPDADTKAAAGEEGDEEEEVAVGTEINEVFQIMAPWLTSLLFHLGVIVLALFVVWSVIAIEEEEDDIIPMAQLSENPGAQMTKADDVSLAPSQNVRKVMSEDVVTESTVSSLSKSDSSKNLKLVGLSGGGGGKIAPFGTVSGSGKGMKAKFFGSGGNARKIIYIVDASGSLIDTLPFVIKELKRSISVLTDKQSFTVIFFQAGSAVEVPPRGWKKATAKNKKFVNDWVTLSNGNIIPIGSTDPIAAIKIAMALRPQLIFLLSDNITGRGRYEVNRDALLKMLDKANRDRKMKINTIQFLYPDPLNTLKEIAKEHGGIHKFVVEKDLGLK